MKKISLLVVIPLATLVSAEFGTHDTGTSRQHWRCAISAAKCHQGRKAV
jgi:hypothetical protein